MKAKRILLLDTGKEWGGGTHSMIELLKRIDRARFEVTGLFYHNYRGGEGDDLATALARIGIPLRLLPQRREPVWAKLAKELARGPLTPWPMLRRRAVFAVDMAWRIRPNAHSIAAMLRQDGFDLLYMNNQPSSNLEGLLAAEATGTPAVQHCRIEADLNAVEVAAANRIARSIVCVSQGVMDSLTAQGIATAKCRVVLNGIDGTQTVPEGGEVRSRYGFGADALVIGTVGSLIARKGVRHLLNAIHRAQARSPTPMRLLVVGDGPQRGDLERQARELGLASCVHFAGFQKEVMGHLAAMDVFCLVSAREGLPRVVLEAMLAGKPVVATDVVGSRELVRREDSGLLVPYGDEASLADALLRLAGDAALRQRLGRRGREIVLADYSIERYVAGVERVFQEALP